MTKFLIICILDKRIKYMNNNNNSTMNNGVPILGSKEIDLDRIYDMNPEVVTISKTDCAATLLVSILNKFLTHSNLHIKVDLFEQDEKENVFKFLYGFAA